MPRTSRPMTIALVDLQQRIEAAVADPRPNVSARVVFKRLRDHHARLVKAARREKS